MAVCKLPAVMGPWNKSNCQSGLRTPPRQCFLDLAKFVLGNIIHSLLAERITCQCSPGCIEGKLRNIWTCWLTTRSVCSIWHCETPVYILLGVSCVNLNGQIQFLNLEYAHFIHGEYSNSTATDLFANWIYFWKILFLCVILLSAYYLPVFVVAVVVAGFIQWCSLYLLFGRTELFESKF